MVLPMRTAREKPMMGSKGEVPARFWRFMDGLWSRLDGGTGWSMG
jgi:hypothetical protein